MLIKISDADITDGRVGIQNHIKNNTSLFDNVYVSNPQRQTIAYKDETNNIKKDDHAKKLASHILLIVKKIAKNVNEKKVTRFKPINEEFLAIKYDKDCDEIKEKLASFLYSNSVTEDDLKNKIVLPEFEKFKSNMILLLFKFTEDYKNDPSLSLMYGIDSIVYYLLQNNCVKILTDEDDTEVVDKDFRLFIQILQQTLYHVESIVNYLYAKELKRLGASHGNYELTKEAHESITKFIQNPDNFAHGIKENILSYLRQEV